MKIIYLCSFNLNRLTGTPIRAKTIVKEMLKRRDAKVISLGDFPKNNIKLNNIWKIPKKDKEKFRIVKYNLKVLCHLIKEGPLIVHSFTSMPILATLLYKRLFNHKCTLIFEMHGMADLESKDASLAGRTLSRLFDKAVLKYADKIISVSYSQKDSLIKIYGVAARKIEVLWGPVDFELFPYSEPNNGGRFIVGYSGNDSYYQGLDTVIKAARILKDDESVEFRIIGTKKEGRPNLRLKNTRFLGVIEFEKISERLAECSVLLSPRICDMVSRMQYPHKLSIYLAAGRPIIGTDAGDQGMIIRRADCGTTVEANSPELLAKEILRYKGLSYEERRKIGEGARKFAEEFLSVQRLGDKLEGIYKTFAPVMISDVDMWDRKYSTVKEEDILRQIESISKGYMNISTIQVLEKYLSSRDKVLEAGCGTGRIIISLMNRNKIRGYGVDFSGESIQLAKRLACRFGAPLEIIKADLINLPFPDNFFDIVFGDSTLEHIPDYKKALKEIVRVTKYDGKIIISVPNKVRPDGWDLYKRLQKPSYPQMSFTVLSLKNLFISNGLEVAESFGQGVILKRNFRLILDRLTGSISCGGDSPCGTYRPNPVSRCIRRFIPAWACIDIGLVGKKGVS